MLKLTWTDTGLDDLAWWVAKDPKILKRIIKLCLDACKNPTSGIGKPEVLAYDLKGYWSRRITQEHRLVYAYDAETVTVIQCRFHYKKSRR